MSDRLREDLRLVEENWDIINDPEGRVAAAARRFLALTETGRRLSDAVDAMYDEDDLFAAEEEEWDELLDAALEFRAALADYLTEVMDGATQGVARADDVGPALVIPPRQCEQCGLSLQGMSTTPQYEFNPARMSSKTWAPNDKFPCMCEQCGQTYEEADWGGPATTRAYTCDDCGGYVMDADETREASE